MGMERFFGKKPDAPDENDKVISRRAALGGLAALGVGALSTDLDNSEKESSGVNFNPREGLDTLTEDSSRNAFEDATYQDFIARYNREFGTDLSFENLKYEFEDVGAPVIISIKYQDKIIDINVQQGVERTVNPAVLEISYLWFMQQLSNHKPPFARPGYTTSR